MPGPDPRLPRSAGAGLKFWRERAVVIGPLPITADTVAAAAPPAFDSIASVPLPTPSAPRPVPFVAAGAPFDAKPSPSAGRSMAAHKSPPGKVALNRAGVADLTGVPGIGEKTAEAILAYRRAHGEFREVRELLNVKGIGEKKLEKMRAFLVLSPVDAEEPLRQASLSGISRR
jgi:competence protein ComEA